MQSCESGASALKVVEAFNPDIFLLDLMMPEMDGEQLFAELRKSSTTRKTPVIFLTAQALEESRSRLLALGALEVIHKPFDPMELPDLIRGLANG